MQKVWLQLLKLMTQNLILNFNLHMNQGNQGFFLAYRPILRNVEERMLN